MKPTFPGDDRSASRSSPDLVKELDVVPATSGVPTWASDPGWIICELDGDAGGSTERWTGSATSGSRSTCSATSSRAERLGDRRGTGPGAGDRVEASRGSGAAGFGNPGGEGFGRTGPRALVEASGRGVVRLRIVHPAPETLRGS